MPKALSHYYGAKSEQLDRLLPIVESIPHHTWVEAACGMASLTLAKKPAAVDILNDIDERVVCLFEAVRDKPKWLSKMLVATPYSLAAFRKCQTIAADPDAARHLRGYAMLVCLRQSFSTAPGRSWSRVVAHSRRAMASSVSRWISLPDQVADVMDRLRTVQIDQLDIEKCIEQYDDPDTLFYIDLPYEPQTRRTTKAYAHEADRDAHKRMLHAAINAEGKFVISGYAHPLYDKTLTKGRGWERVAYKVACRSSVSPSGKVAEDKTREEVLWIRR